MAVRPKRVLNVLRSMNPGGVETWLMHLLRRVDRRRLQLDFLVHTGDAGAYDQELLELGGGLFRCTDPLYSPAYPRSIGRVLRQFGPYDAVHSHVHHFSGYFLMLARWFGVPARIAHCHNDTAA